jgi:hypothetical protein
MRGEVLIVIVALVCLLSHPAPAQNHADRDAISKIRALEAVWDRAQETGDVGALDLIFDSSMIYVDEDGSLLTKTQFLHRVVKESGTDVQWLVSSMMSVNIYGNAAVVVGSYSYIVRGTRGGKPMRRSGRFIDTWAFKKGVWMCVVAQATPVLRRDGR